MHTPVETGGAGLIVITTLLVGIFTALFPEKKNRK